MIMQLKLFTITFIKINLLPLFKKVINKEKSINDNNLRYSVNLVIIPKLNNTYRAL